MPKQIFCVRHGRTAWNAAGRFQGSSDIPLDEVGRAQAESTADHLAGETIRYALCSPLVRAVETAQIVLRPHDIKARTTEDLRERGFGEWEGLTWAEILARAPEHVDKSVFMPRDFEPPDGERFADCIVRVMRAFQLLLDELPEDAQGMIVAHAGTLHALLDGIFGSGRTSTTLLPASYFTLDIDGSQIKLGAKTWAPALPVTPH